MRKSFKSNQLEIQKSYFDSNKLGGIYKYTEKKTGKEKEVAELHLLKSFEDNFFNYSDSLEKYFSKQENNIGWWHGTEPTTNTLSSQIACLNHLFYIRNDKDSVLKLAQNINPNITDVVKLKNDSELTRGFISFEVVSEIDHLNESQRKDHTVSRGSNCTSIDALILATLNGKQTMLVIEWKYIESYSNEDKSQSKGGETRTKRYNDLIQQSKYLQKNTDKKILYTEPFYQLMRQTLWAEEMISNKGNEIIQADDFIHVHVIPENNDALLRKDYFKNGKGGLVKTWLDCLKCPEKYVHITPQQLLTNVKLPENLREYLQDRYWQ